MRYVCLDVLNMKNQQRKVMQLVDVQDKLQEVLAVAFLLDWPIERVVTLLLLLNGDNFSVLSKRGAECSWLDLMASESVERWY